MKETKMRDEFEIIKSITRINGEINKLFTAKEFLLKALSTIYPPVDEEATPASEKKKRGRKPKALGKGIKPPMGIDDLEKRQKSAVAQQVEDHYFGDVVQKPFSKGPGGGGLHGTEKGIVTRTASPNMEAIK